MSTEKSFDITKVSKSRLPQVDLDKPGFGRIFSDHMLEVEYSDARWQRPKIKPYGTIEVSPAWKSFTMGSRCLRGPKPIEQMSKRSTFFG